MKTINELIQNLYISFEDNVDKLVDDTSDLSFSKLNRRIINKKTYHLDIYI